MQAAHVEEGQTTKQSSAETSETVCCTAQRRTHALLVLLI
jgi:hypothetical protein